MNYKNKIKLIKSDSKDIYNFYFNSFQFQINAVLLNLLFIKESRKKVSCFLNKNIKQQNCFQYLQQ